MKRLTDDELDKIADAVETLRLAALGRGIFFESIQDAVNVLDNADLFAEIDAESYSRHMSNIETICKRAME